METNLIVENNKQGKNRKKKFTYLNPNAPDSAVEGFVQMTSSLTSNEYQGAYIVTKRRIGESIPYVPSGGDSSINFADDDEMQKAIDDIFNL